MLDVSAFSIHSDDKISETDEDVLITQSAYALDTGTH